MKLNYENKLKDKKNQEQQAKLMQKKVDSLQGIVNSNASRLASLESQLQAAQSEAAGAKKGLAKGYYYRVQLGAYKFFDVKTKSNKQDESFLTESSNDVDKYVVGLFFSIEEADKFKDDIRKLGIKDAFVVPYKDGQRITHKEALEGIKKQNATSPKPNSGSSIIVPSNNTEKKSEAIIPPDFYNEYILVSIHKFEELNSLTVSSLLNFKYSNINSENLIATESKAPFKAKTRKSNSEEKLRTSNTTDIAQLKNIAKNSKDVIASEPKARVVPSIANQSNLTQMSSSKSNSDIKTNEQVFSGNNVLTTTQSEIKSIQNNNTSANTNQDNNDNYSFEPTINNAIILGFGETDKTPDVQRMTYKELQDAAFSFRQV